MDNKSDSDKNNNKCEYALPRGYLSYSQIDAWLRGREYYRTKYYGQKKSFSTPEMNFGNKVTLAMEAEEEWTNFIPRLPVFEHKLDTMIDGVRVVGAVDNVDFDHQTFFEQKTGRTKWTQNKVNKHKQIDLYSLLLTETEGKVFNLCYLVDVRTEKIEGKKFGMKKSPIQLTGEFNAIERKVSDKEREEMRKLVVQIAREIEEDWSAFKHLY